MLVGAEVCAYESSPERPSAACAGHCYVMMIILLLFLQKQNLAYAVYQFGIGTLLTGLGSKKTHVIMFSP